MLLFGGLAQGYVPTKSGGLLAKAPQQAGRLLARGLPQTLRLARAIRPVNPKSPDFGQTSLCESCLWHVDIFITLPSISIGYPILVGFSMQAKVCPFSIKASLAFATMTKAR